MKVEDVMINDRVCLKPQKWQELYEAMIQVYPDRKRPAPLQLAAWNETNDAEKRNRFCMHLEFALSAGVADKVLEKTSENDWCYAKKYKL